MKHSISIKTINGVLSISDFKAQRVSKSDVIGVVYLLIPTSNHNLY